MSKINFTKEHLERLKELATKALFGNVSVMTKMGSPLTVHEMLHTTTIDTLKGIKSGLAKKITNLEEEDEWVKDNNQQTRLEEAKFMKELVNLIIGYKRFNLEKAARDMEKKQLKEELDKLKESQKTPEDKIKEIEEKLKDLESEDFN